MYHSESMGLLHLPQYLNFDATVFTFVVYIIPSESTMNAFAFRLTFLLFQNVIILDSFLIS